MFHFTKEISLVFLEFCDIHEFVNIACLSKENLQDIQYYFKTKKVIYKNLNIKKTIKNSLFKINFWSEKKKEYVCEIAKVVKLIQLKNGENKNIKIYYWCISSPVVIGSIKNGYQIVIYPNHRCISDIEINNMNLIPFR